MLHSQPRMWIFSLPAFLSYFSIGKSPTLSENFSPHLTHRECLPPSLCQKARLPASLMSRAPPPAKDSSHCKSVFPRQRFTFSFYPACHEFEHYDNIDYNVETNSISYLSHYCEIEQESHQLISNNSCGASYTHFIQWEINWKEQLPNQIPKQTRFLVINPYVKN